MIFQILAIRGGDRKLHISSSVSTSAGVGPWTAVDCVDSAHLFAAGRHNDLVYVCAVDDCKVGVFNFVWKHFISMDAVFLCSFPRLGLGISQSQCNQIVTLTRNI